MNTRTLSYYSFFKLVDAYTLKLNKQLENHLQQLLESSGETQANQMLVDVLLRYYTLPVSHPVGQRVVEGFELNMVYGLPLRNFVLLAARQLSNEKKSEDVFAELDLRTSYFKTPFKVANEPIGLANVSFEGGKKPTDYEAKMLTSSFG